MQSNNGLLLMSDCSASGSGDTLDELATLAKGLKSCGVRILLQLRLKQRFETLDIFQIGVIGSNHKSDTAVGAGLAQGNTGQ